MSLTDSAVRAAFATDKPIKAYDADGLYLLVQPSGSKLWRFKYRYGGREQLISLGRYPAVSLKQARAKRDAARSSVANGTNPSAERQAAREATGNTFEAVSAEYLEMRAKSVGAVTLKDETWRLNTFLLPHVGRMPIAEIGPQDLLVALRKAEARGLTDTVQRTKQMAGRIFRFGAATGRCKYDVAAALRGAVAIVKSKHRAAITDPKRVGELLTAIDGYDGQVTTRYALRLLPLVFLRSSELRGADWAEIDLDGATWRVPAGRMKMNQEHIVPLSRQAVEAFTELKGITGGQGKVFPSYVPGKVISENTLNCALRRLGFSGDEQTAHGFRTIASTFLNELGVAPDLIELQLAHTERNGVRAAYNRAQRLEERRVMMQTWADHLDGLRQLPA